MGTVAYEMSYSMSMTGGGNQCGMEHTEFPTLSPGESRTFDGYLNCCVKSSSPTRVFVPEAKLKYDMYLPNDYDPKGGGKPHRCLKVQKSPLGQCLVANLCAYDVQVHVPGLTKLEASDRWPYHGSGRRMPSGDAWVRPYILNAYTAAVEAGVEFYQGEIDFNDGAWTYLGGQFNRACDDPPGLIFYTTKAH